MALFGGQLVSCKKPIEIPEELVRIDTTRTTLFIDSTQSSIVINNSGDSTRCYDIKAVDYRIVQIAPDSEYINYVVKQYTSTVTCDGHEGQKRTIRIELRPVDRPAHVEYVIQHDCDVINLEHDYYGTVVVGCCDAEPVHRIYDYQNNLLLQGNVRIAIGAIPNNPIKFFVGYTPTVDDTVIIGTVDIAFSKDRRYRVNVLSPPLPPDMCSQYSPLISLVKTYGKDTLEVFEDEYQLWDLEEIRSADEVRNVSVRVIYQCEEYYTVEPVFIPITNGKPFGKDSMVQQVRLIHVTE
jgi:hypothetical protein